MDIYTNPFEAAFKRNRKALAHAARAHAEAASEAAMRRHARRMYNAERAMAMSRREFERFACVELAD